MPAYNEEGSVGAVVREVYDKLPRATCLVVDDGSVDATAAVARAAGAHVASLPFNLGVGGAMRVGFAYARAHGFRAVVQVDADGQHDPGDVRELIALLSDSDLALGARFAGKGTYKVRGPRRWAIALLARILSHTAKAKLTDPTSGFRASGPRAIALFAEHYPAEYLGDTIESLVIACRAGFRVTQLPVSMRERAAGVPSHNPFRSAVYLGRVALAVVFAFARPGIAFREGFE
ncbi:glycosyltransferase family 2 protein [Microbacterium sp. STN6]|uniref:glycosyltransferase family 2 protein n=1 Tax=Microbacterium sp. STN6 TaxID=2995588 RepID=UPI002260CE06|nr:glycosyltransferase family 2 protein [Microbacterium sp. STN6]MCX7521034.1 glycosyltransferase family 2 protein [Microbacterium sp. STN6]